jgi:hypothetical protein
MRRDDTGRYFPAQMPAGERPRMIAIARDRTGIWAWGLKPHYVAYICKPHYGVIQQAGTNPGDEAQWLRQQGKAIHQWDRQENDGGVEAPGQHCG